MHTFGCKVNTYDTGLIEKNLKTNFKLAENNASTNPSPLPLVHVLNTCAVTAEATKQAVRLIRKLKAQSPFSTIVVTGCAAQVDTDSFRNLPGADLVVANSHKGLLPQILDQYFKGEIKDKVFKSNIFHKEDLESDGGLETHHTRSFLKIQDGCNSFCTFCIIPYARGKSRSIPISSLVNKINELHSSGLQEVVLTGVHIGDYEDCSTGSKRSLEDLIETVLLKTTLPRIRLTSLEPIEISERLLSLFRDSRLCPHFHMSIQSANTDVLTAMKRKYSAEDVEHALGQIAELLPNSFVGMDVIAGFPSETDEQFDRTYEILARSPWTRLHVFPYSERLGTRAAGLVQIPFQLRKERASRLRGLSLHRFQSEALKQINSLKQVLILNGGSKKYDGLAADYWPVKLNHVGEESMASLKNKIFSVRILEVKTLNSDVFLLGSIVHD